MASEQQKGAGTPVVLRDRFLIFPASPLPEFNIGTALAFLAQDRRTPGSAMFALIVRPGFPSRADVMRVLKSLECPGMLPLLEWGVVDWPPAARKVMAVVYAKPKGGRVVDDLKGDFRRIEESDITRKIITPITAALKELRSHGITHRAIRPTNMFWATPERDRIVLGDCCTAPPGSEQPALIETIESGMTTPAGRGNGNYADDCYAFGMSLLLLLLGHNPLRGKDDEGVIHAKIARGTFGSMVDDRRLSLATTEILRGLLCDDPEQRWDAEAIDLWLGGRRLTPLLAKSEKRAARALTINGRDYFFSRDLAMGLAKNWETAKTMVADGRVELWLRRSLDQKEKAEAVAAVTAEAASKASDGKPSGDYMLTKTCMVLDGLAPIRYKGLSVMPGGFGPLLAVTLVGGGDVRVIAEALMRDCTKAWLDTRPAYNPDNSMLEGMFRSVKLYLERGSIGNGMERVLYELNDAMPCVSPFTIEDYVIDIRDLLPALNIAAKKAEGKGWPVDRHVAGFISARANFDVERQIADLSEPKAERAALAVLDLLATLQWRLGHSGLYGLCGWMAGSLQPVIESYHNREKRKQLEKELPRLAREGSLVEMARLLDNPEERARDSQGFDQARFEWAEAAEKIKLISEGENAPDESAVRIGRQVAALISVSISFITVTLLLLQRLL